MRNNNRQGGVTNAENNRSTSPKDRTNAGTEANRVNTNNSNAPRTNTTSPDRVNTSSPPNSLDQITSQNRGVLTTDTDLKNTPITDRLFESATSKQHKDDNANQNRRNKNTQTVERIEKREDIHNLNQDDKVQQTAAANSRKILYMHLNMTQDQIQKLESMMHNQNNTMSENVKKEFPGDRQIRMDGYFKENLNEEQFKKFETWKRDNLNTRF